MTIVERGDATGLRLPPGSRARRGAGQRVVRVARWAVPMAPALAVLSLLFAGPIIWSVYTAFTDLSLSGQAQARFTGLANFRRLLNDQQFLQSLWLTLLFVVGSAIVGQNCLGMLLAFLMRITGKPVRLVISTVVVSAWVVPELVAAFCWYAFLARDGTLNHLLHFVGSQQNWLFSNPMLAVILANVWRGTAFSMMMYSAALSDIPPELVEAAQIDGAGAAQRFFHVSLPLIRRAILSNLMLITLQTLAVFGLIFAMTGGGPGNRSATTPVYMYEQAFKFYQLGYGTAMAVVLLAVGAVFSLAYLKLLKLEDG
jgi:multiple sugar transport system permease protein